MHVDAGVTSGQLFLVSYKGVSNYLIVFPVTGFPNWKCVAILASFLAPVKFNYYLYFCK